MRSSIIVALIGILLCNTGCTHTALQRRTINQASTLTDLQHQQVVDNLAMFAANSEAMAWHLKLKGGVVQVADAANAGFGADLASNISDGVKNIFSPSIGAQRGVVGQWDVDPTAEADELELLGLAYRKMIDPTNDEVICEIYKVIAELSVRFDILPSEPIRKMIFRDKTVEDKISNRINTLEEHIKQHVCKLKEYSIKVNKATDKVNAVKKPPYEELAEAEQELSKWSSRKTNHEEKLRQLRAEQFLLEEMKEAVASNAPKQVSFVPLVTLPSADQARKQNLTDQKSLLLAALEIASDSYVPSAELHDATQRNVGLVAQAEDKIRKLEALLDANNKLNQPWLCRGPKPDKCACYVGHYCGCKGECYVWVMPEQLETLREFTLTVLALAPIEKQESVSGRGAAFSPTSR